MSKDVNMSKKVKSGLIWKFMEYIGARGITVIVQIVLARILAPEEYAVVSIATVIITFMDIFIESGFGLALIQKKYIDSKDCSTIYYVSAVVAVILYTGVFFSAPIIANIYNMSELIIVLRLQSLVLFSTPINIIQDALLRRKMEFKKSFFSVICGVIINGIVGISMALSGYGVMSLVVSYIANVYTRVIVLCFLVRWKPTLEFSFTRLKSIIGYSGKVLVTALLENAYNSLSKLFIGYKYTKQELGYYDRGLVFPEWICRSINGAVGSVMFSTFTIYQEDREKLKNTLFQTLNLMYFVISPFMFGLIAIAPSFIVILLTDKWIFAIPYMQLSCIFYLFTPIITLNSRAFLSVGRSDIYLKTTTIKFIVGVIVMALAMNFGIFTFIKCVICVAVFEMFMLIYMNSKIFNFKIFEEIKILLPNIIVSTVMCAIVYSINYVNLNIYVKLIMQIVIGIIVYVVISHLFKIKGYVTLIRKIKQNKIEEK